MNKKFAIVLALSLIAIVCCAGCIDPQDQVDPVDPVVPVDPVDPVTPPVEPVVPAEEYSVFFMLNYDGAGAYSAETVTAGDAVSKPATPTRSGYTFKGWFTAAEGGAEYDFTQAVTADLTLYAQWSKKSSSSSGSSSSGSSTPSAPTPEAVIGGQSYATVEEAIGAARTGDTIALTENPDAPLSLDDKEVTLTYPEDTSIEDIKIKKDGASQVTVEVPYTNDDGADGTKTVIFEEVDENDLLVPSAAVDTQNQVGDAYTAYGLTELAKIINGEKVLNAPVEDAPTEHVQDGWDVMFYEPAPTALGTEAESDEESVEKETTDTPESWTITLQNDIIGDITVTQKQNVKITINGNDKKFDGVLTVDGNSSRYETAALTIKNVNFEADSISADAFIRLGDGTNAKRYTNHVTVKDCTFTGNGFVAVKSYTGGDYNLTIDGCTVNTGMHSLAQLKNVEKNLQIKNCIVSSKNGLNVNNGNNLDMINCTFDVQGYAVRFGSDKGVYDRVFNIIKSTLKSACAESGDAVIEFRSGAISSKLILEETVLEGTPKFKGATADTIIIIDGCPVKVLAEGLTQSEDENGDDVFTVSSAAGLKHVKDNNLLGSAGSGDQTLIFEKDAEIDMSKQTWTPIKVDGYNGADIITIEGNGATITGLTAPLFAGGFAGGSGIIIKDLTIADSDIVSSDDIGSGAFIEYIDSMDTITLINCHLTCSTVTGDGRTGGLIGWTAGYNNVNDGPVKTYVTIQDCSVTDCEITAPNSVGGLYGHAGNNAWTYSTIENCIVKNNILTSTDDGDWRVGVVVGTANVGEVTISNIEESGNTLTQTGKTAPAGQSNLYGRFVPGTTGKLVIDGNGILNGGITYTLGEDGTTRTYTLPATEINGGNEFNTFRNLLTDGDNVVLGADVSGEADITAPYGNKYAVKLDGGVIDGSGHELHMECYGDDYGIMTTGGTVKNIVIKEGCRAVMIMYPTEDVILDNVNIGGDGVLYPINTGEAGAEGVNLIVRNSVIAGWTSYSNIESASFTNVEFTQGTYYNNIYGRVLKPYVNTELIKCSFIEHMNLDLSALVEGHKIIIKDCTVNGQAVTANVFTVPTTGAEYDTELFTVDLPSWATSINNCIVFE